MESETRIPFEQTIAAWGTPDPAAVAAYHRSAAGARPVICVLDDDPTGIQTVHGVDVILRWSPEIITDAFRNSNLFYVQTNSRGRPAERAAEINREIFGMLHGASQETGREFRVVSRSDSTLRGHYPLETDTIRTEWERRIGSGIDAEIIVPFFQEAGRLTIGNIHYVREGKELVPAGLTEFARDRVFGYQHSDLRKYVEEKTAGAVLASAVKSIGLGLLRSGNLAEIESILAGAGGYDRIVINAIEYDDLRVFVAALERAERQGKVFLFRSAASFVKVYGHIADIPLLTTDRFRGEGRGVLTLVGSHVGKTTRQLDVLRGEPGVEAVELNVPRLLSDERSRRAEVERTVEAAAAALRAGRDPVVFTSRTLVTSSPDSGRGDMEISHVVSTSLSSVARLIPERPLAVMAKGGITSSDVATEGLDMVQATVLGQILPGVPVVRTGRECRFPSLPYVIFPGNVGDENAVRDAYRTIRGTMSK